MSNDSAGGTPPNRSNKSATHHPPPPPQQQPSASKPVAAARAKPLPYMRKAESTQQQSPQYSPRPQEPPPRGKAPPAPSSPLNRLASMLSSTRGSASAGPKPSALASALRTPGKARPIILTAMVTTITVVGALWGATLKMKHDAAGETERRAVATPEERVSGLVATRERLVGQAREVEVKLAQVEARIAETKAATAITVEGPGGGGGG